MISPIDAKANAAQTAILTKNIFSASGWLKSEIGLEHRPEQEEMAVALADAFMHDQPTLFEAGTGVGKSLAYLVPGLLHAVESGRPMLVSTNTISLQEQLLNNDIPLCRKLFGKIDALKPFENFEATLLVGKHNYLCPPRLDKAIISKSDLFLSTEAEELTRIAEWSEKTKTGLLEELVPRPPQEIWEWVNADSPVSNPRNAECFYQKARAALRSANLIIVNHALLFSLLNAGAGPDSETPGILFPNDFLLIDEAHRVPAIASEHLGLTISSYGLDRVLKQLYNPKSKRGLLRRLGSSYDIRAVLNTIEAASTFFTRIRKNQLAKRDAVRLMEANWTDPDILPPLKELAQRINALAQKMDDDNDRDELLDKRRRINACHDCIFEIINVAEKDHVYWLERSGQKGRIVHLRAAPLDTAPYLRKYLLERGVCTAFTSATLQAGTDEMHSFRERIGTSDEPSFIVDSPFDYETQMDVLIQKNMPALSEGKMDTEHMSKRILEAALEIEGGTLVLFTSYHDLQAVAAKIAPTLLEKKRPLYVQGESLSRTELTRRFKEDGNALLLGTDSFWTGVDVPGPALSQVIVTRLPFENPSHPVFQARCEWYEGQGLNPFQHLTLPDALIKFRQGVGRLIRKSSDEGRILILDSRILHKTYGRSFIDALPTGAYETS